MGSRGMGILPARGGEVLPAPDREISGKGGRIPSRATAEGGPDPPGGLRGRSGRGERPRGSAFDPRDWPAGAGEGEAGSAPAAGSAANPDRAGPAAHVRKSCSVPGRRGQAPPYTGTGQAAVRSRTLGSGGTGTVRSLTAADGAVRGARRIRGEGIGSPGNVGRGTGRIRGLRGGEADGRGALAAGKISRDGQESVGPAAPGHRPRGGRRRRRGGPGETPDPQMR